MVARYSSFEKRGINSKGATLAGAAGDGAAGDGAAAGEMAAADDGAATGDAAAGDAAAAGEMAAAGATAGPGIGRVAQICRHITEGSSCNDPMRTLSFCKRMRCAGRKKKQSGKPMGSGSESATPSVSIVSP